MVMVMEILFHLGRPLAMRLLYKAPRTAQIQVTVGPVKEGGGVEKHTIIVNRTLMMIRVKILFTIIVCFVTVCLSCVAE